MTPVFALNHSLETQIQQTTARMCYHKRYLFTTCGHSLLGPSIIAPCPASHSPFTPTFEPPQAPRPRPHCSAQSHPYQTLRIDRLCPCCDAERERLLALEEKRRDAGAWAWGGGGTGTEKSVGVGVSVLRARLRESVVVARFE